MPKSAEIALKGQTYPVSRWTAEHLRGIANNHLPAAPLINAVDAVPLLPGHDLWDLWPLQDPDGCVAQIAGGECWMILSAPKGGDPGMRHDIARTRLLFRRHGAWHDCGLMFPDDLNPGTREWSGSARYDAAHGAVTAYFTAAGRRGKQNGASNSACFKRLAC